MRKMLWLAILAVGCGSDSSGPDADVAAELVGEWVAEPACAPPCHFTLTSIANPQAKLDAVSFLESTIRIDITRAGRFDLRGPGVDESGTVETRDGTMVVRGGGTTDTIDYTIQGEYLYLDFRRVFIEVSFDQDTIRDPANVTGVFRRH